MEWRKWRNEQMKKWRNQHENEGKWPNEEMSKWRNEEMNTKWRNQQMKKWRNGHENEQNDKMETQIFVLSNSIARIYKYFVILRNDNILRTAQMLGLFNISSLCEMAAFCVLTKCWDCSTFYRCVKWQHFVYLQNEEMLHFTKWRNHEIDTLPSQRWGGLGQSFPGWRLQGCKVGGRQRCKVASSMTSPCSGRDVSGCYILSWSPRNVSKMGSGRDVTFL